MTREDNDTYESYAEDIFDNPPAGPVGVHQGNSSFTARAWPYLLVIVIAVVAGVLVWGFLSGEVSHILPGKSDTSSQTRTSGKSGKSSQKADEGKAKKNQESEKKSDKNQDSAQKPSTASAAPAINKQVSVSVVNGTSISGYAAQKQSLLQQSGYTSVTAGNMSGQTASATVVWYQNDADKATAQDVANTLGITDVQQQSDAAAPITVVLMN